MLPLLRFIAMVIHVLVSHINNRCYVATDIDSLQQHLHVFVLPMTNWPIYLIATLRL